MNVFLIMNTVIFSMGALTACYYYQTIPLLHNKYWLGLCLTLALCYIFSHSNSSINMPKLQHCIAWGGNLWLAFSLYSLMLAALHLVLKGAAKFAPCLNNALIYLPKIGFVFIILFLCWGVHRAFSPDVRTETIATPKISRDVKIALVSDIHLGLILDRGYAQKLAERVRSQNPDMVLIAGDIIDEKFAYVQNNRALEPLQNLSAPLGVYAVFGNHDYIDRNSRSIKEIFAQHHINLLEDENAFIKAANIKISGLKDYSRAKDTTAIQTLAAGNDSYYSIIIDHQPRKIFAMQKAGYDLTVSGHTHGGQLWPFRYVTKKMYPLDFGRQNFGQLTAVVTDGYGFWGPPVRTGPRPEIVVINLRQQ